MRQRQDLSIYTCMCHKPKPSMTACLMRNALLLMVPVSNLVPPKTVGSNYGYWLISDACCITSCLRA